MAVIGNTISSSSFFYDKSTKTFSADASELKQFLSQLYDDACDAGFVMLSSRTGTRQPYYLDREIKQDNEVMGWELLPALPYKTGAEGTKVVVFND